MAEKVTKVGIPKESFLKLKKAVDEVAETIMAKEMVRKGKKAHKEGRYKSLEEVKEKYDIQ